MGINYKVEVYESEVVTKLFTCDSNDILEDKITAEINYILLVAEYQNNISAKVILSIFHSGKFFQINYPDDESLNISPDELAQFEQDIILTETGQNIQIPVWPVRFRELRKKYIYN